MSDRATRVAIVDELGKSINENNPLPVDISEGFDIPQYDRIEITYVASGNGEGEIETVVYKMGAVVVATLTLAYDSGDNLASVIKS